VLVSARKFPGIDATKLDAVAEPATIEKSPRRLTAPELLDETLPGLEAPAPTTGPGRTAATAELGDVRTRIAVAPEDL
jgi:DNA recombination protein RmuC